MQNSRDPAAALSVLTLGHSRHSIDTLLGLLHQHRVDVLVDVRSQPYSRFSPQFSRPALERAVTCASLRYLYLGDALGGRPTDRACYAADGTLDYRRVEQQAFYQHGIDRLVAGAAQFRICLMCAEEDPARCHRRLLITQTLLGRGVAVDHIRASGGVEPELALRDAPAQTARPPQLSLFAEPRRGA